MSVCLVLEEIVDKLVTQFDAHPVMRIQSVLNSGVEALDCVRGFRYLRVVLEGEQPICVLRKAVICASQPFVDVMWFVVIRIHHQL